MSQNAAELLIRGISVIGIVAASATIAVAQDVTEQTVDSIEIEPIVVTGEKVGRSLQKTASSVSVIKSSDLKEINGAATVSDAIASVPNVVYNSTVGAPIIRGQDTQGPNFGSTAFFGGTIPRATVNFDGHYQNFYEYVFGSTPIWDVDSIEVFRGPQTTSQGANAIAGAIIVNTKDPTFTREAAYQAEIGSYNRRRTSLMLNGPIIENQLAGRLAIDYWGRDTFIDYVNSSFSRGDINLDFRSFNARAKLLWEPTDLPELSAKLTYSHTYNNRPTWEAAFSPYEDLESNAATMPSWNADTDTAVLDVNYDLGNDLKLFNQTQFSNTHVDRVAEPASSGSAVIDQQNYSNETRLTFGNEDSVWSGVVGLYLATTRSDDTLYIAGTSDFDDRKNNLGLFAETSYRLTDRWLLTGGLRYQVDDINRTGTSPYAPGQTLDYDETFDAFLPKLSIAYDLTPDVTVGALISRGYNPGGVNLSFAGKDYITFKEETVWNYELFVRAALLNNRLNLTGNLFYADYTDSQRLLPDYLGSIQYGSVVVNADSAQAYGLEVGADYRVFDNLRLKAGAGLLHTEIGQFTDALGISYKDNEFGSAPGYMLSVGLDWTIIPDLKLGLEARFTDGYYSTDENKPAYEVDKYVVANARLSYALHEHMEIYGFVNNIFDERSPLYFSTDRSSGINTVANMLEPRTFGIGIKGTF
ncbi:TonB-dependent receptor [uncultured Pleomorphomonas sp.]|uniref:TonB-dependent receptor n=1 Tax=uncultured Pleomorphomonas sp. TaxID=442121 RepID=A0A212LLN9_9HYPH|nr:TonB-dependent receptor [uncultured Pleomorphomonas sp.]